MRKLDFLINYGFAFLFFIGKFFICFIYLQLKIKG